MKKILTVLMAAALTSGAVFAQTPAADKSTTSAAPVKPAVAGNASAASQAAGSPAQNIKHHRHHMKDAVKTQSGEAASTAPAAKAETKTAAPADARQSTDKH